MKYADFGADFVNIAQSGAMYEVDGTLLGTLEGSHPHKLLFLHPRGTITAVVKGSNNTIRLINGEPNVPRREGVPDAFAKYGGKKMNPYLQSEIKTTPLDKATGKKLPTDILTSIGEYLGGAPQRASRRTRLAHMRRGTHSSNRGRSSKRSAGSSKPRANTKKRHTYWRWRTKSARRPNRTYRSRRRRMGH